MKNETDYIKDALVQAELNDPFQNSIDLLDQVFEISDSFNTELSVFDLQSSLGRLKKYHEFNKLLIQHLKNKR